MSDSLETSVNKVDLFGRVADRCSSHILKYDSIYGACTGMTAGGVSGYFAGGDQHGLALGLAVVGIFFGGIVGVAAISDE